MNDITQRLIEFRDARDWRQFHTPENLAKSISIEAGELLQCFQWECNFALEKHVERELADVLIYCLYLCHDLGLDPSKIVSDKIDENERKYPVDKARGNARKYTEL